MSFFQRDNDVMSVTIKETDNEIIVYEYFQLGGHEVTHDSKSDWKTGTESLESYRK